MVKNMKWQVLGNIKGKDSPPVDIESIAGAVKALSADPVDIKTIKAMVSEMVREAIAKLPAPKEANNGKDGADGRDALQLDILPSIDLEKSYPRGTYAHFDGGIIRAYRNTIPCLEPYLAPEKLGWEVVIAGLAEIEITLDDNERTFVIATRKTLADSIYKRFSLPVLIYREIYKPDNDYMRGDVVTYGGSAWHCQADHAKGYPGKSEEWRLMVKEGRTGAAGKDGEKGERGPAGKDRDLTQMGPDGKKW